MEVPRRESSIPEPDERHKCSFYTMWRFQHTRRRSKTALTTTNNHL
ncbi:hypothetical protein KKH3_32870 [Pectobacterium actinidiae]|nr:hypothetical protein KKH3_32870 [Pectobacterium actinidiae]